MRVTILHHAVSADDSIADRDVLVQRETVAQALDALGHDYQTIACTLDLADLVAQLDAARPDVVFNLVESLGGSDRLAPVVPAVLDVRGIPYTGTRTDGLMLTSHKILAKRAFRRAGLPTPDWLESSAATAGYGGLDPLSWSDSRRFILKTVFEHASFALDDECIVGAAGLDALRSLLAARQTRCGRCCLAEEYIDGREFNLSILAGDDGPQVLPSAEIDFSAFPAGKPWIVGQTAKWDEGSFEFNNTPSSFVAARAEPELCECLADLARRCWMTFELGGYARVDFRVDAAGRPWILEVNANPCLSPDAGFVAALAEAEIPFEEAVARILSDASRS
jgi:D-alanine-D-alanine ligase